MATNEHISTQTLAQFRQEHTITPSRELDSTTELSPVADIFFNPAKATAVSVRLERADAHWHKFLSSNEELDELSQAVIERQLAEISFVRCAVDQVTGEIDRSDDIKQLQEKLFDYYNPELFQAAVRQKISSIEALSLPAELEQARAVILDQLDQFTGAEATRLEQPTDATIAKVGDWIRGQYGDIFDEINSDGVEKYDASAIAQYFQMAVDSTPALRDNGWVVEVVEREKNVISVHAADKKICISSQRTTTSTMLKKLLTHEVFGHALRAGVAEDNGNTIGQQGTATYARFEESFMIALEQCLDGKYNPSRGIDHYLAVGLSVTEGLSMDAIARLFESIHMLQNAQSGLDEPAIVKSKTASKNQIQRSFAGMTDVDDGIAYRKDIDYLHGLNDSWGLLNFITENDIVDEAMPWLLSAKFNPFDAIEREYVSRQVPMPVKLQDFFAGKETHGQGAIVENV